MHMFEIHDKLLIHQVISNAYKYYNVCGALAEEEPKICRRGIYPYERKRKERHRRRMDHVTGR
jgi:hypothetical protein